MSQQISLADMLTAMTNVSVTGGWDAVCAMSLDQVNFLLQQVWDQGGRDQPIATIACAVQVDADTQAQLNVSVGPPLLEFTAADQCQVRMWLTGGSVTLTSGGVTTGILSLAANTCQILGTVPLAAMSGLVVSNGHDVVVDLTKGGFEVSPGVLGPAGWPQLADAIGQFFASNQIQYPLASVTYDNTTTYDALTPVSLSFATQSDSSGNSCLLVFITTKSGAAGTATSLAFPGGAVPIPAGSSAALFISSKALFAGVLATQLTTILSPDGGSASGVPPASVGAAWTVASNDDDGAFDLGTLDGTYDSDLQLQWSTAEINAPTYGLVISAASGGLAGSWQAGWQLPVSFQLAQVGYPWVTSPIDLQAGLADFTLGLSVHGGGTSQTVRITASDPAPTASYSLVGSEFTKYLDIIFGVGLNQENIGAHIAKHLVKPLRKALVLDFSPFSVFALSNLLFGSGQVVLDLQQAHAPGDLLITGITQSALLISPVRSCVQPGEQVQFSVLPAGAGGGAVQWSVDPSSIGQIVADTGLYTAPATAHANNVDTVSAIVNSNPIQAGYTSFTVTAPLTVSPAQAELTAGQSVSFAASQAGSAVTDGVTWQISDGGGAVGPDGSYQAPLTVTQTQQVTLTCQLGQASAQALITLSPVIAS